MPDLPPGFELESRGSFDPLAGLLSRGIEATNGFRTQGDIDRLKREGYTPASNSDHLRGDAVDLAPGKSGLDLNGLLAEARKAFGPEATVEVHNGSHVHVSLKGWGQAPGTPGTPRSGLPALPEGFELQQRGSLKGQDLTLAQQLAQRPVVYDSDSTGQIEMAERTPEAPATNLTDDQKRQMQEYLPKATSADDYAAFVVKLTGGKLHVTNAQESYDYFHKTGHVPAINVNLPEPPKNPDGVTGATARGFGDPVNLLDELGAGIDTLGGTGERESIWNSDRSAKDILYSNIDLNRGILKADERDHPFARIGGQIASGLVIPIGTASTPLEFAKIGAIEGGVAGFGAGEGNPIDRLPGTAAGTVIGGAAGYGLGHAIEGVGHPAARKLRDWWLMRGRHADYVPDAASEAVAPTEAAMAVEQPSVSGRIPDRIDVAERPAVAPGTAEQRAAATEVKPEDVIAPPEAPQAVAAPPLSDVAKAGNINLANIETPEDIDALMRFTAHTFGDFQGERRGVKSWAETEALAKDLGMTPDDLLARRTGEAFNAEQAHAARGILSASATETRKLADTAVGGSDEDRAAFVKSFLLHAAITEKASGAAAEAGRALNIYRKVSQASLGDREAMQDAIRRMQGGTSVDEIAEMVRQLGDDPSALNRFAREAIKPRFRDKLMFVWINSLLSGPKTHVVNMSSNLLTAAMSMPEHALAAGIGKLHGGDKVLLSELGPRFYGMVRGGAESLAAARQAFKVGDAGGKIESVMPAIGGKAGRIISIPTRALNAEDVFFKSMARRSELAGLAVRKAKGEGLKGGALTERIGHLVSNPTDEMIVAAHDAALYKTFQRPLGPAGQKLAKAIESWGWPKLFVPFIRTPTNLLKYAVEHSPASPLLREVRQEFAAGGAKRDLAVARMVMGTGIGMTVAGLADKGMITGGGPADPSAKRALQANGWQPYSFKIGDTYISYRRLDPWATVLGMAADSVELQSAMTEKQQRDAGAVIIGAMVQNLSSKTWLSGFSDLIDAVTDPQANAKNVLTRLGASMATPTLLAQVAQSNDPVFRDTNGEGYIDTLRKKIEARVPGLSTKLIPRRDIMGDEVKSEAGPVGRLISPFDVSTDRHDPEAKVILESGARISVPQRTLKGARLPDEMYDVYQSYAGQLTRQYVRAARTDPDWATMNQGQRRKLIEKVKNRARKDARVALFAN